MLVVVGNTSDWEWYTGRQECIFADSPANDHFQQSLTLGVNRLG